MLHFWCIGMEKGEIWGRHPLDIPKPLVPSHVSIWHFDILREIRGKFPCGIILGDSIGKRGGNIHRDTCNSPLFPLNFCREISTRMIPWNSPWIWVKIWGTRKLGIYLTNKLLLLKTNIEDWLIGTLLGSLLIYHHVLSFLKITPDWLLRMTDWWHFKFAATAISLLPKSILKSSHTIFHVLK